MSADGKTARGIFNGRGERRIEGLTYVLITLARDEAAFIDETIKCARKHSDQLKPNGTEGLRKYSPTISGARNAFFRLILTH